VDISGMAMDTVIRLSDITLPAGVTPTAEPETPIVTVLTMRAEVADIEAADAEVAGEQADDTGAAGAVDQPAEGGEAEGGAASE